MKSFPSQEFLYCDGSVKLVFVKWDSARLHSLSAHVQFSINNCREGLKYTALKFADSAKLAGGWSTVHNLNKWKKQPAFGCDSRSNIIQPHLHRKNL